MAEYANSICAPFDEANSTEVTLGVTKNILYEKVDDHKGFEGNGGQ